MRAELKRSVPIAETFARLLHPFAEVVIHDLKKDQIEAIYNPFSRREVGDRSYLDRLDFASDIDEEVIGPYEKINYDGRKLKCISLVLRSEAGRSIGLLCVNMDISVFESFRGTLQAFIANNDKSIPEKQQKLFKDDLYEQINAFVQKYCRERHLRLEALSREDKQALILQLKDLGAFDGKNATQYIARTLNISRATVYNYLRETELLG